MLKMKDVYIQNPALGDASSLDKKLEENAQKLDRLNQELIKFGVSSASSSSVNLFFFYKAKLLISPKKHKNQKSFIVLLYMTNSSLTEY